MAQILDGNEVSGSIEKRISDRVAKLKDLGINPTLGTLRIGRGESDYAYELSVIKHAQACGVGLHPVVLPFSSTQEELDEAFSAINDDPNVHGILVFSPFPKHLDEMKVIRSIDPIKDVDGITARSIARLFMNVEGGYAPCTAEACIEILDHYNIDTTGKRAVIVGRSAVVGRPAAMMMMHRNATVTICHTRTVDLPSITREADILIIAVGKKGTIGAEHVSPGQIVIDVGIVWDEENNKLCGDVIYDEVEPIVDMITPVPGGVGLVTTSVLIEHVVEAAERLRERELGIVRWESTGRKRRDEEENEQWKASIS